MPHPRRPAALAFWLLLAAWTWKLLEPNPVPEAVVGGLRSVADVLPFLAAKSLHAGGYAVLAALAWAWLPTRRGRLIGMAGLLLHGAVTEMLQYVLPFNRTGRVADVLIDWFGVTAGVLVAWRWCRKWE